MLTIIEDMVTATSKAPSPDGSPPSGLSVRTNPMLHSGLRALHPASSAIDFLTLCHRYHIPLSRRPQKGRVGSINQGIKGSESIADHMYRMALMSLIAGDVPGSNRERTGVSRYKLCTTLQKIAIELFSAIVGDITPSDGVPEAVKSRMEQAALDEMCLVLGGGIRFLSAAGEIKEIWTVYENNSSVEANLGKDLDKVEMILQALEYEMGKSKFQTKLGKSWAAVIIARRNSRLGKSKKGYFSRHGSQSSLLVEVGRHPAARQTRILYYRAPPNRIIGSPVAAVESKHTSVEARVKVKVR
ncbi:hypothetical protein DVH24_040528 [Malus domestica]|uniref:HD domain-containing protein n=1 Tax=Malus domestica TaxID=3750 RepID=A0A498ICS6_MALDO|nr:hypothetical protein DVH24_040528 [Malus domestica]